MRNYRVYLALVVVLLAIVGALLHPLALLLSVLPVPSHPVVSFLTELRSTIANFLGWVVLAEGGGTFFAEDLPKLLAYVLDADLVVGNRVVRGLIDQDSQMDYFFTWGNMAVAMLLRLRFWDGRHLGPAGLSDVGCTYRAIRRSALKRILPDLVVGGNHFSPHMLLVAMAHDLSVVEIPIRLRRRLGQSKGASQSLWKGLQVGLVMIWHIL